MRRSASEVIRELEMRVAKLERTSAKDISDEAMMWFESNARKFNRIKYTGKRMGGLVFSIPQKRAVKHELEVVISKSAPNSVQASFFRPSDNKELHSYYIDGNWVLITDLYYIQSEIIIEAREASRRLAEKLEMRTARLERHSSTRRRTARDKKSMDTLVSTLVAKSGKSERDVKRAIFTHLDILFENYKEQFDEEYEDLLARNPQFKVLIRKGIMSDNLKDLQGKFLEERDAEDFLLAVHKDFSFAQLVEYYMDWVR